MNDDNYHHKLHDVSIPHQKRAIRSFIGCPSAKDFAKLWGFELNELENVANQDQFVSISCVSEDSIVVQVYGQPGNQSGIPSMVSGVKMDGGSSISQQGQILYSDKERQSILQQIIDLKRLQLNEVNNNSSKINELQETDLSSSALKKLDEKFNQQAQKSQGLVTDFLEKDNPMVELNPQTLSSTFSQLDSLSSSSIIDIHLHGESFWTCKSPLQSIQLWSQNIQDLGICEELVYQDDFNIPDVDLTFQNFEELFGRDLDPTLGDQYQDVFCSSLEKSMLVDKSEIDSLSAMEAAAFITISQSAHENKDVNPLSQYYPRSMDPPPIIQPFESTISFSVSRFSAESNRTDQEDCALSPIAHLEARGNVTEV